MRATKAFPKELYGPLDEARKALKLSQTEIARRTGLPQATISNLLRGQAVQKESILAVLKVLTEMIGARRAFGGLSEDVGETARLSQAIQKAYTFCASSGSAPGVKAHPGGGMPTNAVNRLDRPALWHEMEEALKDHPFSMAVDGPFQAGKTTLLLQLAETARREGFAVAFFDCIIVPEGQPSSVLFSGLARTLASQWGVELSAVPPADTFSFTQWLLARRRAQPEPKGILILDQITDLEMTLIDELESVIRGLHNQRGWLNLSFVVARCPKSSGAHDWMLKSRGYFHPTIEVGWLDEEQVQNLVELHPECPQSPEVAIRLFKEFQGQPYLTHVAIDRLGRSSITTTDTEKCDEVLEESRRHEGSFGWFCREMKRALLGVKSEHRSILLDRFLCGAKQSLRSNFYKELLSDLKGEGE
jgi:hypothetical protein